MRPQLSQTQLQLGWGDTRPPSEALLLSGAIDHAIAAHLEPAIRDLQDAADGRIVRRDVPGT